MLTILAVLAVKLVTHAPPPITIEGYVVTAYTAGDGHTPRHGVTASGKRARPNHTAACPRELPFGTRVIIPEIGRVLTCEDRGGAIKGRRLDVYVADINEAIRFGRREMLVVIVRESRRTGRFSKRGG